MSYWGVLRRMGWVMLEVGCLVKCGDLVGVGLFVLNWCVG